MGFVIAPKVVSEFFEDEAIVVNLETGSYYSFRGSAVSIWKKIEDGSATDQIVSMVEDQEATRAFLAYILSEALARDNNSIDSKMPTETKIGGRPEYSKYDDMKDLLLLDPIHEVDKKGWPNKGTE